jgi:hypothetical protein
MREFNQDAMAQRSLEIYERAAVRGKKILTGEEPARPDVSRWVREMMHAG